MKTLKPFIVLEVEHGTINPFDYIQLVYSQTKKAIPMIIMSYPDMLSESQYTESQRKTTYYCLRPEKIINKPIKKTIIREISFE